MVTAPFRPPEHMVPQYVNLNSQTYVQGNRAHHGPFPIPTSVSPHHGEHLQDFIRLSEVLVSSRFVIQRRNIENNWKGGSGGVLQRFSIWVREALAVCFVLEKTISHYYISYLLLFIQISHQIPYMSNKVWIFQIYFKTLFLLIYKPFVGLLPQIVGKIVCSILGALLFKWARE